MKNSNIKSAYESFWNPKKKPANRIVMFEPVKVKQLSNSPRIIKPTANVFHMKNMSTKIKVPVKKVMDKSMFIKNKTNRVNFVKSQYNFVKRIPDKIRVVNNNTNIPKKEMNWIQAKSKFKNLNPFGDSDKDGLMNYLDCKPFNSKMKDANPDPEGLYNEDPYTNTEEIKIQKRLEKLDQENRRRYKQQQQVFNQLVGLKFEDLEDDSSPEIKKKSKLEKGRVQIQTREGTESRAESEGYGPLYPKGQQFKGGSIYEYSRFKSLLRKKQKGTITKEEEKDFNRLTNPINIKEAKRVIEEKILPKDALAKIPKTNTEPPLRKSTIEELKKGAVDYNIPGKYRKTTRREKKIIRDINFLKGEGKEDEQKTKSVSEGYIKPIKGVSSSYTETIKSTNINPVSIVEEKGEGEYNIISKPFTEAERDKIIKEEQKNMVMQTIKKENKKAPYPIMKKQSPSTKITKDVSMNITIDVPVQTKIPTKKNDKFELIVPGQTWRYNTKAELDKGKKKYIEKMSRLQKRVAKNVMIKDNNDLELLSTKPAPKIMTQERTEVPKEEGFKVRKGRLSYSLTEGLIGLNVSKISRETGADPLTVANVLRKEITIEKIGKDLRENTAIEAKDIVEEKAQKVLKYFEERVPQKTPQTIQEMEKKLRDIKTIKGYAKLAAFSPFLGTEKEAELKTITEKEVPLISQIAALKKEEREKARPKKEPEKEKEKFKMKNGIRIVPRSEMTEEEKRYMKNVKERGLEFYESDDYFVPESLKTKEEKVEEPEEESEAAKLVEEVSREIDEGKTAEELLGEVSDEKEK